MVFSSYTIEAEGYYLKTEFNSNDEYQTWINEMIKRSKFNYNAEVNTDDQILTLSSCDYNNKYRIVLHAKKEGNND